MPALLSACCACSEEKTCRMAASLAWRDSAGRAASLWSSSRVTTCCLSCVCADVGAPAAAKPAIAVKIEAQNLKPRFMIPPLLFLGLKSGCRLDCGITEKVDQQ